MYVIQVIPLIRGTQLESLSYFSSVSYDPGTFLEVPIRGKTQRAITISSEAVSATKTALKAATFSLRKLPAQPNATAVPAVIYETAKALSKRYPASIGSILFSLLPSDIRTGTRVFKRTNKLIHEEETTPQILQARLDERYLSYQTHIRSTFARKGSVLFIVPTSADIKFAVQKLSHGIEDRLITLSSTTSKKKAEEMLTALDDTMFSKLIITTPAHAYTGRADISSIIIEQSASSHYVDRTRPYIDHRDALILYAKHAGASIILGDTVVRTEDEAKRRTDQYLTYGEDIKRLVFPAPLTVITQSDKPKTETPFQLFSPSLIKNITTTIEGNGHVFLYSARRGLAPVVACIDCGYIFRCPDSHTPYSLVRTSKNGTEERWFVSSTSGRRVRAADTCDNCGSWRLRERGIGIQQVYDEWKEKVPGTDITILDHTVAPTPQKAQKIVDEFFAKKSGILLGTQIALPYLNRGVELSAIISLDAARSTPTWRADESLFRLLIKLRECTSREVLVQTRNEPDPLVGYAGRGAIERFFDDEISLRQQLKYPPFSTFILLTWSGPIDVVTEAEKIIKATLDTPLAQYYTNPHSSKEQCHRHALLRIETSDTATYEKIIERIKKVPPYVKVEINPERIV
jgi:primosomal protein N' (replication factor Y) (superfamily II helicase)